MKFFWYRLKIPLFSLLALLLILLAVVGSNLSLLIFQQLAPKLVPGLSMERIDGNLWQGFQIRQLSYQQAGIKLQTGSISSQLDWRCLQRAELCLGHLYLQDVQFKQLPVSGFADGTGATLEQATMQPQAQTGSPPSSATAASAAKVAGLLVQAPLPIRIQDIQLSQIQLQTAQMTLTLDTGSSSLDWRADKMQLGQSKFEQLQLTLAATQASVQQDEAWQVPEFSQLKLPLWLQISTLELTNSRLQLPAQAAIALQQLQLSVELTPTHWQLQLPQFKLSQPQLQLEANLTLTPDTATAALGQLGEHASLTASIQGLAADVMPDQQLAMTLAGPLSALALELQLSGQQQASVKGTLNLQDAQLPMSLQLQSELLSWPLQQPRYQASNIQLAVQGDLSQLTLKGALNTQVTDLPNSKLQFALDWQANTQQLSVEQLVLQTLGGDIQASGSYQLAQQQLQATLALSKVQPGLFWPDYPGQLSGQLALNASLSPALRIELPVLQLQGTLRDLPLQLSGQLALQLQPQNQQQQYQLNTTGLTLQHGPNQLQLTGSLAEQWQAKMQLKIADLSQSLPQSEGQISGSIALSGNATNPDVQLSLQGSGLNYLDDYVLDDFQLQGQLKSLGQADSQLSVHLGKGQAPGLQLQQLDWQLAGTLKAHQSHLLLESHQLQAVIVTEGSWQQQQWQATWQEVRLKSDVGDWSLQQPLNSRWSMPQQTFDLAASCWRDAAAEICLAAAKAISTRQGEFTLQLRQFELAALDALLPTEQSLAGQVQGDMFLRWQAGKAPTAKLHLTGAAGMLKLQSYSLLEIPWQQLELTLSLDAKSLNSQLAVQLAKDSSAAVKIKLTDLQSADKLLEASVQLQQFDLAFLKPLLNDYTQFDGMIGADLQAKGRLSNPALYGRFALERMTLSGKQAPVELLSSKLELLLDGYQATMNGLWQTPQGPLTLSGQANWLVAEQWFAQLNLKGDDLALNLPDTQLTFSPDLQFIAGPERGGLSGSVTVPAGQIKLNALPENAIRVSDDEIVLTSDTEVPAVLKHWQLSSDVRLLLGDDVKLAAFGLNTRLQGQLRIRQQGGLPTVHGQVNLHNGTFRAYGQDLQIRTGKLSFNGPADQPLMAIEAIRNPEKTEDDVIAGLRVNGLVDNPVVEVFSIPSKPQANALAYLLLGRDMNSSGGDKTMTTGLIGLGIATSGNLVGQIGNAFGLKELSLDTVGSGNNSKVTVSGYLSPRLQIKYGVGIFDQFGEFTLRYRLMRKLYLEAVRGLNNSVDVLYKVEFD
jgi:translocation and assembly module TamB